MKRLADLFDATKKPGETPLQEGIRIHEEFDRYMRAPVEIDAKEAARALDRINKQAAADPKELK